MKKKFIAMLLVLAMAVTMLAGCSVPGQSDSGTSTETADSSKGDEATDDAAATDTTAGEKVLRYALQAEPPTLDPQLMNSIPSATVGIHIFDGLTRNNSGEISLGAAESYEMSEDGLTYTFKLKEGLVWSDGEALTADHFVYGMQRLMDPATASTYAFIGEILKNGAAVNAGEMEVAELGVSAPDAQTVVIELEYPASYFLSMLSMAQFCPTRQEMVEEFGQDFAADPEKNAYNGPFMVTEWNHGDRIIISKNPNYWGADDIKLDKVEIITVAETNTQVAMFEAGELDFVEVPAELSANYAGQTEMFYNGAADFIKTNQADGYMTQNKNLRLALNYGLNRQEYAMLVTNGVFEGNTRYVLPQVLGVDGEYGTEYPYDAYPLEGDVEKAKEYLDAAISELGLSSASDISLELLTTDAERTKKEAEVIQAQLQENLGITINIKQVPYAQRLEMESNREFEMVVTGWAPDYSDPYTYLELWMTGGGYNHSEYSNADFDKYMEDSRVLVDPKERMDALFNAEKTFCEDGGVVPLQLRRIEMLYADGLVNMNNYFVGYNYDYMYADFVE